MNLVENFFRHDKNCICRFSINKAVGVSQRACVIIFFSFYSQKFLLIFILFYYYYYYINSWAFVGRIFLGGLRFWYSARAGVIRQILWRLFNLKGTAPAFNDCRVHVAHAHEELIPESKHTCPWQILGILPILRRRGRTRSTLHEPYIRAALTY